MDFGNLLNSIGSKIMSYTKPVSDYFTVPSQQVNGKTQVTGKSAFNQDINNAFQPSHVVSPVPGAISPYLPKANITPKVTPQPNTQVHKLPVPSPSAVPSAMPTSVPNQDLMKAYSQGFSHYGNPPAATLSAQMINEGQQYPIFQQYPFLPAALSILESGGGSNMGARQKPYNITSWGINLPKDKFNPSSVEEVLSKTISGIGKRTGAYQKFRDSKDLNDLGHVYAPIGENPTTGGNYYAKNAKDIMDQFEQYLPKK